MTRTLRKGGHAIYDSLQGEIPVRITSIKGVSGIAGRQLVSMVVLLNIGTFLVDQELISPALWVKPNGTGKDNDYNVQVD